VELIDTTNIAGIEALRLALTKMVISKGVANEKVIKLSQQLDVEIVTVMKTEAR